MIAEYKRDMNHSYLILTGETEADTTSYGVRMLLGNTVPALLKCHLQGLDGKSLFYYEVTSRQSLSSFYENRFLGAEDLRFILGCLLQTLEKLEEYLLVPEQLVLDPDYIFLDLEKKELRFCYLPGYDRPVDEQFRMLVEYLLPKLDHEDSPAVALGYGIYRKALEDQFQLELIREELYQERETIGRKETQVSAAPDWKPEPAETGREEPKTEKKNADPWEKEFPEADLLMRDPDEGREVRDTERKQKKRSHEKTGKQKGTHKAGNRKDLILPLAGCALGVAVLLSVLLASQFGYLPHVRVEYILGSAVAGAGIGAILFFILPKVLNRKKKEENPDDSLRQAGMPQATRGPVKTEWEESSEQMEKKETDMEEPRVRKGNNWKKEAEDYHETVILSMGKTKGPASLVSREPGELATIYLNEELTVIGKMKTAADAVIPLPTVSRLHAKIRKKEDEYYLTDLNSRNGTSVNGRMLHGEEEYQLQNEDEVDFAQARYIFLK